MQTLRHFDNQFRVKWSKFGGLINDSEASVRPNMHFSAHDTTKVNLTNSLERLTKEVKGRADGVGFFPNEGAIIRRIGAVLQEANDEWQVQHCYTQFEVTAELTPPLTDVLRTQIATMAT